MKNLQIVRGAVIKANPEIMEIRVRKLCKEHGFGNDKCHCIARQRPIRLADVLLAIGEIRPDFLLAVGHLASWNLRKDNLEEQSEETINFLASLLEKK